MELCRPPHCGQETDLARAVLSLGGLELNARRFALMNLNIPQCLLEKRQGILK